MINKKLQDKDIDKLKILIDECVKHELTTYKIYICESTEMLELIFSGEKNGGVCYGDDKEIVEATISDIKSLASEHNNSIDFLKTLKTHSMVATDENSSNHHGDSFYNEIEKDFYKKVRACLDANCKFEDIEEELHNIFVEKLNSYSVDELLQIILSSIETEVNRDNILDILKRFEIDANERIDDFMELVNKIKSLTGLKIVTGRVCDKTYSTLIGEDGLINGDVESTEEFFAFLLSGEVATMIIKQEVAKTENYDSLYKIYGVLIGLDGIRYINRDELRQCCPSENELSSNKEAIYYSEF